MRNPTWLLGLLLQVVGAILDFIALGYAPQSVVAPLGSLTLVVNVFLAPCMHKERPSLKTLGATLVIIAGAVTTVASSPKKDKVEGMAALLDLFDSASFLVYAVCTGALIAGGWWATQHFEALSVSAEKLYLERYFKYHRFVIGAISGTMGAQNVCHRLVVQM